jgi:ABC-type sugar transport system substrate-binding protein
MPESTQPHIHRRKLALAAMADAIKHDPSDGNWVVWITPDDAAERAMRGLEQAGLKVLTAEQIDAIHSDGFRQGFHD